MRGLLPVSPFRTAPGLNFETTGPGHFPRFSGNYVRNAFCSRGKATALNQLDCRGPGPCPCGFGLISATGQPRLQFMGTAERLPVGKITHFIDPWKGPAAGRLSRDPVPNSHLVRAALLGVACSRATRPTVTSCPFRKQTLFSVVGEGFWLL